MNDLVLMAKPFCRSTRCESELQILDTLNVIALSRDSIRARGYDVWTFTMVPELQTVMKSAFAGSVLGMYHLIPVH